MPPKKTKHTIKNLKQNNQPKSNKKKPNTKQLAQINEIEVLDLHKELLTRDPNNSGIIKTLENAYEEHPELIERLLLQLFFKSCGLGELNFLLSQENTQEIQLEEFFQTNLYSKWEKIDIEDILETKKQQFFSENLIKFFQLFFSQENSIFEVDLELLDRILGWSNSLSNCKINIVRSQFLEVTEIIFESCLRWLKNLKLDEDKERKIKQFLYSIIENVESRCVDIQAQIRLKASTTFYKCLKFYPILIKNYAGNYFQLMGGRDANLRQNICRNVSEMLSHLKSQDNQDSLTLQEEIVAQLERVKLIIMYNFQDAEIFRNQKDFIKLLVEIMAIDHQFLDDVDQKQMIQYIFSKERVQPSEMRILTFMLYGSQALIEDFSKVGFLQEEEQNFNKLQDQLMILVRELILKNPDLFSNQPLLRQLVKALYHQKLALITSYPVMFDLLSKNEFLFLGERVSKTEQEQLILLNLCLCSVQECTWLIGNSTIAESAKYKLLRDIFCKSLSESVFPILNRLKEKESADGMSMFLQLFQNMPHENMGSSFKICLNQIIENCEYYFTLPSNNHVYDRISKLTGYLRQLQDPSLSPVIEAYALRIVVHLKNLIEKIDQDSKSVDILDLRPQFTYIIEKCTIFLQDNFKHCDFEWQQIQVFWNLSCQIYEKSSDQSNNFTILLCCNKILYMVYNAFFQRLKYSNEVWSQQEFMHLRQAILEDCILFMNLRDQLIQKFTFDQAIILLNQYNYHLTECVAVMSHSCFKDTQLVYLDLESEQGRQIQHELFHHLCLFDKVPSEDNFKDQISNKLQLQEKFCTQKMEECLQQIIKIVKITDQNNKKFVGVFAIQILDNNNDYVRKFKALYWDILKQKELNMEFQNTLVFWDVVVQGLLHLLEHKQGLAMQFVQDAKKQYFQGYVEQNQEIQQKNKFQIFILTAVENCLGRQELYQGFQVLKTLLSGPKSYLDRDSMKRIFAFLQALMEQRNNFFRQNGMVLLENQQGYEYIKEFSDHIMGQAGLKKVQFEPLIDEFNDLQVEEVPEKLKISKKRSSLKKQDSDGEKENQTPEKNEENQKSQVKGKKLRKI